MVTVLEDERCALEELDQIEQAVSKRIRRNPDIYNHSDTSHNHGILGRRRKINTGETVLQQHEIAQFIDRYKQQSARIVALLQNTTDSLNVSPGEDAYEKFSGLLSESVESERGVKNTQIYEMFSCNPPPLEPRHKYRVLSEYAGNLKLSSIYTQREHFGKFLDLEDLYQQWLSLPRSEPLDNPGYLGYLGLIDKFDLPYDKYESSHQYLNYLQALEAYLRQFLIKTRPLDSPSRSIDSIANAFESLQYKQTNVETDIVCTACEKTFSKATSYASHLNGKKHKKAVVRKGETLRLEYTIKELLALLDHTLASTQNEVQRIQLLTVREKQLEGEDAKEMSDCEYDLYGTSDEEESDQEEDTIHNPLKLPIGPDGRPMPFWLWKMKGLDVEYRCEVCGNAVYKGRDIYEKHFTEPKHINGLKMLGIMDNHAYYKNLAQIKEVVQLSNNLQRRQREEVHFRESGEQVEDEDGNAISKNAYEELKKQGLL